jgi:hypothetical protein
MDAWSPSDWTAIGALAVAFVSMLITYRVWRHSRQEIYRAAIYAAQVEATRDVLRAAGELHHVALGLARGGSTFPEMVEEELDPAVAAVDVARSAGMGVLPAGVSAAIVTDLRSVLDAIFPSATPDLTPDERRQRINEAWEDLVAAVRHELDADELGTQIRQLTSIADREAYEPIIDEVRRVEAYIEGREPPAPRRTHASRPR